MRAPTGGNVDCIGNVRFGSALRGSVDIYGDIGVMACAYGDYRAVSVRPPQVAAAAATDASRRDIAAGGCCCCC